MPGMPHEIAPDDIVRTHAEAEGNERVPLVVVEPLEAFLDDAGLGSGELDIQPVGDGHSNHTYVVRREDGTEMVAAPPAAPAAAAVRP